MDNNDNKNCYFSFIVREWREVFFGSRYIYLLLCKQRKRGGRFADII